MSREQRLDANRVLTLNSDPRSSCSCSRTARSFATRRSGPATLPGGVRFSVVVAMLTTELAHRSLGNEEEDAALLEHRELRAWAEPEPLARQSVGHPYRSIEGASARVEVG